MTRKTTINNRNLFSAALILLLALTRSVGSDAGALPSNGPSLFSKFKAEKAMPTTCVANLKRPNGQCFIPRGGSATVVSASDSVLSNPVESLTMAGAIGAWLTLCNGISNAAREFWSEAERTKFLLAGAVAGIVSRTFVSPLEVVATAQMVRGGNKGMIGELAEIFQNEGMKGLFKGNGANCLKVAPTRGVQFFAFETFKKRIVEWKKNKMDLPEDTDVVLHPVERLIAGGFAGMVASSMVYPIEVVKTMLTMYPGKYNGINSAFRGVINEVGFKGLYAGLAPTLVAMFPYVGVEFMIYETSKIAIESLIKKGIEESTSADKDSEISLPIIISLGLGALAGAAAQTSAHPLDVVRKRLQVQGINGNPVLYKNTFSCFSGVAAKEGMGALYRGLGPACVATIPGTGIAYITYELMKRVLGLSSV